MDWPALLLSLQLAVATALALLPPAIYVGRLLAFQRFRGRTLLEALLALPLVLPPTVIGYYLLGWMGRDGWIARLAGEPLAFSFEGLWLASLLVNVPFAVQPIQRAFERIDPLLRDAGRCCGLRPWQVFWKIEAPLAWPGMLSGLVLVFAHTLGEFGVVLMVGGNIEGLTRTVSIAIYDQAQGMNLDAAALMSATLLAISFAAIGIIHLLGNRFTHTPRS